MNQQHTVRSFAAQYGLTAAIDRAISFAPAALTPVWEIPVERSERMDRCAGEFRVSPSKLRIAIGLHPALFGSRVSPAELAETFLHEVAHALQWLRHRRLDHGATWWEAMHQLGQQPRQYHSIEAISKPALAVAASSPEELGL